MTAAEAPPADPAGGRSQPGATGGWTGPRSLLDQLTADAIASDYAQAPAEPPPPAPSDEAQARRNARLRRQQLVVAATGLGLAGFVLAMGISARITNEPVVIAQRKALMERIEDANNKQSELAIEVAALRSEVEKARISALEATVTGSLIAQQIQDLELVTGYIAVTGPGIVVTMTDSTSKENDSDPELSRVLDSDIQQAVNGLWRAGAEAISINDQRLSARSAIRSAAGAILVNYRPLRPPYKIAAIGDPASLEKDFLATPDAKALAGVSKQFGIGFSTAPAKSLDLPAATGRLPEQATVVEAK